MIHITVDTTKPNGKEEFMKKLSPFVGKDIFFRGSKDVPSNFRLGKIKSLNGDFIAGVSETASAFGAKISWLYVWYEFEVGVQE